MENLHSEIRQVVTNGHLQHKPFKFLYMKLHFKCNLEQHDVQTVLHNHPGLLLLASPVQFKTIK